MPFAHQRLTFDCLDCPWFGLGHGHILFASRFTFKRLKQHVLQLRVPLEVQVF